MRLPMLLVFAAVAAYPPLARAQDSKLFVTENDISQLRKLTPKLRVATDKGPQATRALATAEKVKLPDVQQRLYNVSVAYTAVKMEESIAELEALGAAKDPSSAYAKHLAEAKKQLDDLTGRFREAKGTDGRSALEVNQAYVRKNLKDVEQIVEQLKDLKVESMR